MATKPKPADAFQAGHNAGYIDGRAAAHHEAQAAATRIIRALINGQGGRLVMSLDNLDNADRYELLATVDEDLRAVVYETRLLPDPDPTEEHA